MSIVKACYNMAALYTWCLYTYWAANRIGYLSLDPVSASDWIKMFALLVGEALLLVLAMESARQIVASRDR